MPVKQKVWRRRSRSCSLEPILLFWVVSFREIRIAAMCRIQGVNPKGVVQFGDSAFLPGALHRFCLPVRQACNAAAGQRVSGVSAHSPACRVRWGQCGVMRFQPNSKKHLGAQSNGPNPTRTTRRGSPCLLRNYVKGHARLPARGRAFTDASGLALWLLLTNIAKLPGAADRQAAQGFLGSSSASSIPPKANWLPCVPGSRSCGVSGYVWPSPCGKRFDKKP